MFNGINRELFAPDQSSILRTQRFYKGRNLPGTEHEQLTVYSIEHNGRIVLGMGAYLVRNNRFTPLKSMGEGRSEMGDSQYLYTDVKNERSRAHRTLW